MIVVMLVVILIIDDYYYYYYYDDDDVRCGIWLPNVERVLCMMMMYRLHNSDIVFLYIFTRIRLFKHRRDIAG